MDIIYTRKIFSEYEFACYPADMAPSDILKTLSDFVKVLEIKMLLTEEGYAMGLLRVKFVNNPSIPTLISWKKIYNV